MGSIVKSIGKAIKKVAKGIKKVIKKIGPALIIAAAVYAGVAFYGSTLAGATGATLGPSNFMQGLSAIGTKVTSFFSPTAGAVTGAAPAAGVATAAAPTTAAAALTGPELFTGYTGATNLATGAMGATATTGIATAQVAPMFMSAAAGGMTTGQALIYMTKMNMLATGVKMVAGFLDDSEEKQMQHDKDLLAMRYAYGKPMTDEQKAWKAENPNWIREHPAIAGTQTAPMQTASAANMYTSPNTFASQTMANLPSETTPPSPYVRQQRIGQPTFGRGSTRQFETPASRAIASKGPGLITKGTQGRFNPNQQRYS